jgi:hypothetical protein
MVGWGRDIRLCAAGDADLDVVWERYAELARWSQWSPHIRRVEPASGRICPGLRGTVRGPGGIGAAFEVVDVDVRSRTWRWRVTPRAGVRLPVELDLDHAVHARPGGGSRTTLVIRAVSWAAVPIAVGYAPVALALRRPVQT